MPPQEPKDEGMISSADLARRLKELKPALGKYTDESVVDAFLAQNPKFRPRIKFELPPAPVETTLAPRGAKEKGKEVIAGAKAALPAAGAIGAVALTPESGGLTGILLPLLTAFIGGGTGKAAEDVVGHAIGEQDPGLRERLKGIGTAGLEQTLAELGGRSLETPIGKLLGQGSRVLTHPEDIAVKEISDEFGLRLSPSEIQKRGIQETLQKTAEGSMLGRSTMQAAKERTFTAAENAANEALAQLSRPTSSLSAGKSLQNVLEEANDIFHKMGSNLYQKVDQLGGGLPVDMRPIKQEAAAIKAGPAGQAAATYRVARLSAAEKSILDSMINGPDYVPFTTAHELRKRLLKIGPQPTALMPGAAQGLSKKFIGMVTEQMDVAGRGLAAPNAVQAWKTARAFWKDGAEIFDNNVIQKLVETEPSKVIQAVKTPEDVKRIKDAIFSYNVAYGSARQQRYGQLAWDRFRQRYVREVLLKSPEVSALTTRIGGTVEAQPLLNLAQNLRNLEPEMVRELFSDPRGGAAYSTLEQIGKALERVNAMPPPSPLNMWKVFHITFGLEEGEWVLAKALTHPRTAKMVLYAIRQLPRSLVTASNIMDSVAEEVREEDVRAGVPTTQPNAVLTPQ